MAGYLRGSQAWYDHSRRRLVALSEKLKAQEITQAEKDEYIRLIDELANFDSDTVVNNPI